MSVEVETGDAWGERLEVVMMMVKVVAAVGEARDGCPSTSL